MTMDDKCQHNKQGDTTKKSEDRSGVEDVPENGGGDRPPTMTLTSLIASGAMHEIMEATQANIRSNPQISSHIVPDALRIVSEGSSQPDLHSFLQSLRAESFPNQVSSGSPERKSPGDLESSNQ